MRESKAAGRERRNGQVLRNLTTHWTEARDSWPFIREDRMLGWLCARSVNSGVRFLLNAMAQKFESAILNMIEAEDLSCVLLVLECYEPRASI
jgi:hypothetical protein